MKTEDRIKEVLAPLIAEVKQAAFINPNIVSDDKALGIIISKFVEWDADRIKGVAMTAFEDSNFRHVKITGL